MGYGRSVSRFVERKRTIADENLGPLVETEMTRCIQCTRCVRVMSEVAGTYELGGMERGEKLQIGTYVGKPLMSELSGNVIDVCPVGALTNKAFRFRARAWELIARESIGYHDALGSNLWLHTRRGEVLRTVPRDNEAINECWLSDRDRYSHEGLYATDRASKPMVKRNGVWFDAEWEEALRVASETLKRVPAGELGALVHGSTSTEEGHLLARLVRGLGSQSVDHRLRQLDFADGASAATFETPIAEIEKAGVIVLIGCNPRNELPLLNARLRKAVKRGAKVFVINPLDLDLTYELAGKRIVAPHALLDVLLGLAKASNDAGHLPESNELAQAIVGLSSDDFAKSLSKALSDATSSVLIVGETSTAHAQASWLRTAAKFVAKTTGSAYNEIPLAANSIGLSRAGVLPRDGGLDVRAQFAQPRKGYVLYGIESASDFADGGQAWNALAQSGNVVAFSAFASDALKQIANVILPIGLLPEIDATLTNLDGISQRVAGGSKLPGDARPGWKILRALGSALALDGFGFTEIAEVRAQIADVPVAAVSNKLASRSATSFAAGTFERITTTAIYRTDAVLRRAESLAAHPLTRGALVTLHPQDALALGIGHGGKARIGETTFDVELTTDVPRGAVWIEAGYAETDLLPPYGAALTIARA